MVQRDYILRLIEQIGAVIIALRKRIFKGDAGQAEVEETLQRGASNAGMPLELARVADIDALPGMIAPAGEVEPLRCWLLAEVLMTDGLNQQQQGFPEAARSSLVRAAALFRMVDPVAVGRPGFYEARERLDEIDRLLAQLEEPS